MYKVPQKKCRLRDDVQQIFKHPEYMQWIHNIAKPPCFCCGRAYYYTSEADKSEIHHIKEASSDNKDDRKVIVLCGVKCHRLGTELSAHGTPKKFRETFSIEVQRSYGDALFLRFKEEECG